MTLTLTDLLWTQAWSGAPLYLMGAVAQGLWLHRRGFALGALAAAAVLSTALAVLMGVVLWGRLFAGAGAEIMLWEVVNLPGAVAAAIAFPLVGVVVAYGFK